MKRWVLRFSRGLNLVVLPAMTIVPPTMPLAFQLGYGVVVLTIAHRAVEEWHQPSAARADRVVAAFAVNGLVLSGVLPHADDGVGSPPVHPATHHAVHIFSLST